MNLATEPAAAVDDARPARGPSHGLTKAPLQILLADDCRIDRMLVTAVVRRWGIVPAIACNGEQALALATSQAFDLVLMGILMPVMDGVVATARIRQFEREDPTRQTVPIVAYTSLELGSDKLQLRRVGLTAVLPKPCSATSLRLCLERWCPGRFFAG
jgi:CheY-like chemotaxis protein